MKDKGWEGMQIPLDYLTLIGHIVHSSGNGEGTNYSGEQCLRVHIIPHGGFMFRCLYFAIVNIQQNTLLYGLPCSVLSHQIHTDLK